MKIILVVFMLMFSGQSFSQSMSGPRIGLTYLSPGMVDFAAERGVEIEPVITQFGWQFENKFLSTSTGPEGVTTLIPLVGGLEQGAFVPSLTWLIGLRMRSGYEFAVGPNISVGTSGMAFVFGHSTKLGEMYIPKNVGIVMSKDGVRLSFLFGFNSKSTVTKKYR